jgi:hypothetical protein
MDARRCWPRIVVTVVFVAGVAGPSFAATGAQRCAARELKATGTAAQRVLGCHASAAARNAPVDALCVDAHHAKLETAFTRAEGTGGCLTSGDAGTIADEVDAFVDGVVSDLAPNGTEDGRACAAGKLKATGKKAKGKLACSAKAATRGATVDTACLAKAELKFAAAFAAADGRYLCAAEGNADAVETGRVDPFVDAVVAALPWNADGAVEVNGSLAGIALFPVDNWWNRDVSTAPVAADSDAVIDFIGRATPLHPDFGTTFGIPYVIVEGTQPRVPVSFFYADKSDPGAPGGPPGYPIPEAAKTTAGMIEGGVPGGGSDGDRHLLLVDRDQLQLFELYATRWTGSAWTAGSGAFFDLTSNARRPEGWTSADAAGLAILPGLVRADEVFDAGEIRHALRFTVRGTQGYVYPASHEATSGPGGDARPPLGLRVRLKAGFDVSSFAPPVQVILRAMQRYGMIIADNGSDWFVTGAPSARWDDELMHDEFLRVTGDDFEVVE